MLLLKVQAVHSYLSHSSQNAVHEKLSFLLMYWLLLLISHIDKRFWCLFSYACSCHRLNDVSFDIYASQYRSSAVNSSFWNVARLLNTNIEYGKTYYYCGCLFLSKPHPLPSCGMAGANNWFIRSRCKYCCTCPHSGDNRQSYIQRVVDF